MTTELKPCLRCGGKMVVRQPQAFWHEVVCVECDFPYETPSYPKAQDAIDGYNTDYDESPAGQKDAELAALRAEVARMRGALEVYADPYNWKLEVGKVARKKEAWKLAADALNPDGAKCSE